MPKQPRVPILATAATKAVLEHELFPKVMEHWREIAGRIIVVIPQNVETPEIRKIRFVQVPVAVPSLGHVLGSVIDAMSYAQAVAALADPFTVFRWDVFRIFEIATRRQLSKSWMATAHAVRLMDFDTPLGLDETRLDFFCGAESIWRFMQQRFAEKIASVPFQQPAWSGWLANWSTQHVHGHKYHDVTDLHAIARFDDAPEEDPNLEGIGKLTFNPPPRNYVVRVPRG